MPNCKNSPGFTGRLLQQPRHIVIMMLFGFEVTCRIFECLDGPWQVDTLEISLREQLDLVDMVFLVEATVTHKGVSRQHI